MNRINRINRMNRIPIKKIIFIAAVLLFLSSPVYFLHGADAQEDSTQTGKPGYQKKYITVAPGKQYKAGWMHRLFFGAHWRKLWTTPVKVEVLDLGNFAGGLTVVKRGGGEQTKSLRFKGNDGKYWKFRSINKDPRKALPPVFQDTIVHTVLQDQISSANPMASLVLAPILESVGVLEASPIPVWMPDDQRLGQHRKEFANTLGTMEIHPSGEEEDIEGFAGAKKVKGTYKLLNRLLEKRDEKIDARVYLKARLIDLFVGDWDRHMDQWRWARVKEDGQKLWKPIPRDRDQVFPRLDGLLPAVGEYLVMQFVGFSHHYKSIKKMTWNGRYLDRRVLPQLTKKEWDKITAFVKSKLTDSVIENAVKRLPPEHYEIAGAYIISVLKSRRNKLDKISGKYYRHINAVTDVYASDKNDVLEIRRVNNKKTEIALYKRSKKTGDKKDEPYYYKAADNNVTKEIRVFLEGGDDKAEISGTVSSGPLVRVIGGKGNDELIDNSKVKGFFLSVTPIPSAENKTLFYDSDKGTVFKRGPGTVIDRTPVPEPANDDEKFEPVQKDRGSEWYFMPILSYSTEAGMTFGAKAFHFKNNFRAKPFQYVLDFGGSYSTLTRSYDIKAKGRFYDIIKGVRIDFEAQKSHLLYGYFFGYGNGSVYDKDLEKNKFYRLREEYAYLRTSLHFEIGKRFDIGFGVSVTDADIELDNDILLGNFPNARYGLDSFDLVEATAEITYDGRDNSTAPYSGFYLRLDGSLCPKVFDTTYTFGRAGFDARLYFTIKPLSMTTVALRAGGAKNWGDYPFFKAVRLGGSENLRGYTLNRFAGDAALFGQVEIRTYLAPIKLVFPGRLGFHVFAEAGRVFTGLPHEPDKWHPSYGGGLWISFAKRMFSTAVTVANSPDRFSVFVTFGMMY